MRLMAILSILTFQAPLWANECDEVNGIMEEVAFEGRLLKESNSFAHSTVQTGKTETGKHGGRRIELRQRDKFNPDWDDNRGHPDSNVQLFGEDAARFLGFEKRTPKRNHSGALGDFAKSTGFTQQTYLVPDIAEANGALDALEKADLKTGLRFYEAPVGPTGQVAEDKFLTEFIDNGRIPLVGQHDLNFHFASIAIPESWIKLKRDQLRALRDWRQFVKENKPLQKIIAENRSMQNEIDVLTGTVNLQLNPQFHLNYSAFKQNAYGDTALQFLSEGRSPEEEIRRLVGPKASVAAKQKLEEFISNQKQSSPDFSKNLFTRDESVPALHGKNRKSVASRMNEIVKERIAQISEKAAQLLNQTK